MKKFHIILPIFFLLTYNTVAQAEVISSANYLDNVKSELYKTWPDNKTINLVFHGHSVPSGYFKTPKVNTLASYPYKVLKKIKQHYPHAVVNSITTSIGGEHSEEGAERLKKEVLVHRPDVLIVDYALNDRSIGLARAKVAWEKMIVEAKEYGCKIILLTPTPDLDENITSPESKLNIHARQIRKLAEKYGVGLVDSYGLFQKIAEKEDLSGYMAQTNHINEKGHEIVAKAIGNFFINSPKS
jgi:lysophospholipase L1-like esterase